jgi:DNA-binding CsgD family transcriptional regulator
MPGSPSGEWDVSSDRINLARLEAACEQLGEHAIRPELKEDICGEDKRLPATRCEPFTEVATLSAAVGRTVLASAISALDNVHRPTVALDRRGTVLDVNASADALFDGELRVSKGPLVAQDRQGQRGLDELVQKLAVAKDSDTSMAEPILIRRERKAAIIVRSLSVPAVVRSSFPGARALLTFAVLKPNPGPNPHLLIAAFNLSPAEARLAAIIAEGCTPEEAAEQLGIARETARNQLKAVFAKTGTHRQGELVALLPKL